MLNFFRHLRLLPRRTACAPRLRAATLLFALLAGFGGCGDDTEPLVIGIAGPFSQPRGKSMLMAARLAVREINEAGGVGGRQLVLDSLDDSASTVRAIAVAQQLRDDPRVLAVIGHLTSATTIEAANIYNAGRRPVVSISPSASNPDLSGIGPYTFRVCATDLAHGSYLARFAVQTLQARAAAVTYLNDDYGRGILGTFSDEFTRLNGRLTARDPVLGNTADLSPYLELLERDGRAEVLMIAGDRAVATAVLRQARARGLTLPIIGGDGLSGIEAEGALAEGVHITSNYLPDLPGERNARFLAAYAELSGGQLPDHRGAGAYDAVYLIAEAIRDGGPRRERIRAMLAQLGDRRPAYDGVTGRISFDGNGDVPNKSVHVGVIRGGKLVLVTEAPAP